MKRLWLIPVVLCAALVPVAAVLAAGNQNAFDSVVSSFETEYHVHATRVPLMGLVSFISHAATRGASAACTSLKLKVSRSRSTEKS